MTSTKIPTLRREAGGAPRPVAAAGACKPRDACGISGSMTMDDPARHAAEILIVDDDDDLRVEIAGYLGAHGYVVHEAADARQARATLKTERIQLVVLDVMMPGEDGLSLCRSLANEDAGPAVLMLSAMGESIDRVLGLELGADDYVVKPLAPRELLARVRALLRRRAPGGSVFKGAIYAFAGFRFDLIRRQLRAPDGDMLMLTPGELSLLVAFVENPQNVLSREALSRLSRGGSGEGVDRAVDVQVSRLRRKLNDKSQGEIIKTHRGLGYILDAKVTPL
jgi:two-component system OmpR family response regulator